MRSLAGIMVLLPSLAFADVIPSGYHSVDYSFELVNVDEYPDHYLVVFPTTGFGFGYGIERGADLGRSMINRPERGMVSRLYAMPKEG